MPIRPFILAFLEALALALKNETPIKWREILGYACVNLLVNVTLYNVNTTRAQAEDMT